MAEEDKSTVKKILIVAIFIALFVVTYFVIAPFLSAILAAVVIAYVLRPTYNKLNSKMKMPNVAAAILCVIVLVISIILIFFVLKITINEFLDFYSYTQTQDIFASLKVLLGQSTFSPQIAVFLDEAISKSISSLMIYMTNYIMDIPLILLQIFILFFVLFYFLREGPFISEYVTNIMPFSDRVKKEFSERFRTITKSVIYGTVLIGALDGILVGIGLFIFGVKNAFILTLISIFLGVLPLVGPGMVWIPVSIALLFTGKYFAAIGFLIYCILFTVFLSRLVWGKFVGRRAGMANAIALVGMLGGLKLMGIIGLIVGPLILDYFILFVEFYKKGEIKTLI